MLTLHRFHSLLSCFQLSLRTSKCWLGYADFLYFVSFHTTNWLIYVILCNILDEEDERILHLKNPGWFLTSTIDLLLSTYVNVSRWNIQQDTDFTYEDLEKPFFLSPCATINAQLISSLLFCMSLAFCWCLHC